MIDRVPKVKNKKLYRRIGWATSTVLVLLVLYLFKLNFGGLISDVNNAARSVFVPASIAIFIAYLIYPLYKRIKRKTNKPNISAVLTIVIFFVSFLSVMTLIGWLVTNQIINIISRIDEAALNSFVDKINSMITFLPPEIYKEITNELGQLDFSKIINVITANTDINQIVHDVFVGALDGVKSAVYSLISIIMMPVFLFFFLRDSDRIFSAFIKVIPKKYYKEDIQEMLLIANSSTEKYMRAKMLSIFFLSLFFSFSFSIAFYFMEDVTIFMAIAYGITFGILLSVLDLVPYVGPAIGIIIPFLFVLVVSSSGTEFLVFVAVLSIIDILGQSGQKVLIEPYVMSKEVEIHPLAIFSGMLFFGTMFGFVGLVIATPIVATIRNSYRYLAVRNNLYDED